MNLTQDAETVREVSTLPSEPETLAGAEAALDASKKRLAVAQQAKSDEEKLLKHLTDSDGDPARIAAAHGQIAGYGVMITERHSQVLADQRRVDELRAFAASKAGDAALEVELLAFEKAAAGVQDDVVALAASQAALEHSRARIVEALSITQRAAWPLWASKAGFRNEIGNALYVQTEGALCEAGQGLSPHTMSLRPGLVKQATEFAVYVRSRRSAT